MDNISFVNRIDERLVDLGINRAKLLKDLNIPEATIRTWKRGSLPNVEYVYMMSKYLGVTVEFLMTGESGEVQQPTKIQVVEKQIELPADEQEMVDLYRKLKVRDRFLLKNFARQMCDQ